MAVEIRLRRDTNLPALAEVLVRVHIRNGYPVEGVADKGLLAIGGSPPELSAGTSSRCRSGQHQVMACAAEPLLDLRRAEPSRQDDLGQFGAVSASPDPDLSDT